MKTFKIKCAFMFTCMMLGISGTVTCQIASDYERWFYTPAGRSASSLRFCIKFESTRVWMKQVSYSDVRDNLAKSSDYYNDEKWTDKGTESHYIWGQGHTETCERAFEYCPRLSTSSRVVYKRHVEYSWTHPWEGSFNISGGYGCVKTENLGQYGKRFYYDYDMYVAFSPDKTSFIFWKEPANNYDGKTSDKETYTIVPKSELLPKAVNHDFLND